MSRRLTYVHSHQVVAVGGVDAVEAAVHLLLGAESLDDAQSAQRLLYLAHGIAPQGLRLHRLCLQLAADEAHEPAQNGDDNEREERQLPRNEDERGEVGNDEHRVLEQHFERRHDTVLHLLHVTAHAGNDVALALL